MAECEKCKNKMVLVSGQFYPNVDAEPYESGVEEEIDFEIDDQYVHGHYCKVCDKMQEMWTD